MANPQCEDGYTKIANELLEAQAKTRIPGEARQVLDAIARKTFGYNKREDAISLSQFVLATGIKKPNVVRAIKQLQAMNLIIKTDNGKTQIYRINKDFETWKPLSKAITNRYQKRYPQKKENNYLLSELYRVSDGWTSFVFNSSKKSEL